VDCISLENVTGNATGWDAWSQDQADIARDRYINHSNRRFRDERRTLNDNRPNKDTVPHDGRQAIIELVLIRARAKRKE
jgi:electron transport complex protein RnfB